MARGYQKGTVCSIENCGKPVVARMLCRTHYNLAHRSGDLHKAAKIRKDRTGLCAADGCMNGVEASGYCNLHYKRLLVHGDVTVNNTLRCQEGPCGAIGCGKPISMGMFCRKHYQQWNKTGSPYRTIREAGEWRPTANGYMEGTRNGERVYMHRWIAEQALGKRLPPAAEVHHVNGDRTDNRPSNLVVCPNREYHVLLEKRTKDLGLTAYFMAKRNKVQ